MDSRTRCLTLICLLASVGCVSQSSLDETNNSVSADIAITAALADPERSDSDRALDDRRKPDEVLEFLGIEPGMKVFDIFAGGGYYTEILSRLVGDTGAVVHYNNAPWAMFVKKATDARFADNRLGNVEMMVAPPESLLGRDPEFDAAIFVLGMHDIYYEDPANQWVAIDRKKFLQGMYDLLKPGGVLGIIDHNAEAGTDPAIVGKSVHRVDPAVVIKDLEGIGFVLESQSDLLANPDDDKTTSVFIEENRMRTDRSLLRFRKPA